MSAYFQLFLHTNKEQRKIWLKAFYKRDIYQRQNIHTVMRERKFLLTHTWMLQTSKLLKLLPSCWWSINQRHLISNTWLLLSLLIPMDAVRLSSEKAPSFNTQLYLVPPFSKLKCSTKCVPTIKTNRFTNNFLLINPPKKQPNSLLECKQLQWEPSQTTPKNVVRTF